ncbi:MAG TPA: hypothetical protein VGJ56_32400 [Reyranella sp.]|jgi:hypothetical protein
MSALATSLIVVAILIAGALGGVWLRRILPEEHLDQHTRDVVRLGAGLLATIVGLVLGLLISSAKSNYDTQRDEVRQLAAQLIMLDQQLYEYGPEARPVRVALRNAVPVVIGRMWGEQAIGSVDHPFVAAGAGEAAYRAITSLPATTDKQRFYQAQAAQMANNLASLRLTLYEQSGGRMPPVLLGVLVAWLFVLFVSFSLFSPLNPTAITAVAVIALSASGAIFLILEMYHPFSGIMRIDSTPLRQALAPLAA